MEHAVLLFDLDGTLTDPKIGITTCVQYALQYFGKEAESLDELECFIGPPLLESFMSYAGLNREEAQKAVEKYRERFSVTGLYENEVYKGIPELLQALKGNGYTLAIASSKPEVYVRRILQHFQLESYFDVVTGSELDGRRTAKGEVIAEALKRLGFAKNEKYDMIKSKQKIVMIGDRKHDCIGAKENHISVIGAAYGYGSRAELKEAGADHIVNSVEELRQLFFGQERYGYEG